MSSPSISSPSSASGRVSGSTWTISEPFANASAWAVASASRVRTRGSFFSRSMTISIVCLMRRSRPKLSEKAHDLAINAGAEKSALEHVGEEILELAFLAGDDRG